MRKKSRLAVVAVLLSLALSIACAAEPVIFDMDSIVHRPTEVEVSGRKVPIGTAQLVDGKIGKAVKFTFIDKAGPGFFTAPVRPTADRDQADGFSFWVKGDGSANWGGIEMIDRENYGLRYGYCFPTDSTEWKRIVVRWSDLMPELAGPLVDAKSGYAPSKFGNLWFGKWFYWREYPGVSFTIDQVQLEKSIPSPADPPMHAGLARVRQKLQDHKPITIVTMGDSLSDERHWANRTGLWSGLLAKAIEAKYGSKATIVNPAMGGTTLSQNIVVMPRWSKQAANPDLVIVWFGYNDWDSGVRGQRFAEYLRVAVDRIRRQTGGSADVLLLTTCPAHARWQTMAEMEQAVRDVAGEKKTGVADIAAEFRKVANPDEALKQAYWAWDKTHLGAKGHEAVKDVIVRTLEAN